MSSDNQPQKMPFYRDIDGFRVPGFFTPEAFRSGLQYKPRPDDVMIVTYPKCGTTWVQNIVGNIFRRGREYESALEFISETPFVEFTGADGPEKMKRPGAMKLHLPFHMTPYSPEAKYIFVARNPKDCCVSFYYHTKTSPYKFVNGTFDDYFELFIDGKVDFGDYFDTLLSWYEHRNDPNVLFLTYEEIKKYTEKNVKRIAEFIGPEYKEMLESDPEVLSNIIKNSSFASMKEVLNKQMTEFFSMPKELVLNNPDIPEGFKKIIASGTEFLQDKPEKPGIQFVRKGIVGDWRNHFSEEQNARLEAKYRERTKGTDIPKLWENCM